MKKFGIIFLFFNLDFINGYQVNVDYNWNRIYPGTRWCGRGNIANDYNDLGTFRMTDACCRDHKYCPEKILRGEIRYGIHNPGSITILSCQCDQIFYNCLKNTNTTSSNIIGRMYFDVVRHRCFKKTENNGEQYELADTPRYSWVRQAPIWFVIHRRKPRNQHN